MSLTRQIQDAVGLGFAALGDLVAVVTYTEPGGAYNTFTGTVQGGRSFRVGAVITDYAEKGQPVAGMKEIIFNAKDLGFVPETGGKVIAGTEIYQISDVVVDPATATYTVRGRR